MSFDFAKLTNEGESPDSESLTYYEGYRIRTAAMLDELMHADNGLKGAASVIARQLPIVLDPRFVAEFLAPVSVELPSRGDKLRYWMTQSAVIEALESLSIREIGQAGLGLLLLMLSMRSSSGTREFAARYKSEIEADAVNYIATASNYVQIDHRLLPEEAESFSRALGEVANVLSEMWGWAIVEQSLVDAFLSEDMHAFLREAVLAASMPMVDEKLPARLNALWQLLSQTDNSAHMMLAICAWTRGRAMELLVDLGGEEAEIIADVLRDNLYRLLVEDWSVKAGAEHRKEAGSFAAFVGTQIAWGISKKMPPAPYPALLKLADLSDLSDLATLVCEEPYLLHEQLLRDLQTGYEFAMLPELLSDPDREDKAQTLSKIAVALSQSENNPLIELAEQYVDGNISMEAAQEKAHILGSRNPLYVAGALGISQNDFANSHRLYSAVMQIIAWATDTIPDNLLLSAYANANLALAVVDEIPRPEVLAILDNAYEMSVKLGHPLLQSQIMYTMGQAQQRSGYHSEAKRCYSMAYRSCLPLPPPFGRFDALLSLIELASVDGEWPNRAEMRRFLTLLEAYDIENGAPIPAARYLDSRQKLQLLDGDFDAAYKVVERLRDVHSQFPAISEITYLWVNAEFRWLVSQREFQKAIRVVEEYAQDIQKLGAYERALSEYQRILILCDEHNLNEEFSRIFGSYTLSIMHVPEATKTTLHLYLEGVWYEMQGAYTRAITLLRQVLDTLTENDFSVAFRPTVISHLDACSVHLTKSNKEQDAGMPTAPEYDPLTADPAKNVDDFNTGLRFARRGRKAQDESKYEQAIYYYRQAETIWKHTLTREGLPSDVRNVLLNNLKMLLASLTELGQPVDEPPVRLRTDYQEYVREELIHMEQRRNELLSVLLSIDTVPMEYRRSYRAAFMASSQINKRGQRKAILRTDEKDTKVGGRTDEYDSPPHMAITGVVEEIKVKYPEFSESYRPNQATLRQVREALAETPETAFIYLETRSTATVAIIVSATTLDLLELPLSLDDVTRLRAEFRRAAPRFSTDNDSEPAEVVAAQYTDTLSQPDLAATVEQQAHFMGARLWTDLHPRLQEIGITRVVLLPDAFLALLPLHAVPLPGVGAKRDWVLDRYEVAYSQSAAALALCTRRARERERAPLGWSALAQGSYSDNNMPSMASGVLPGIELESRFGTGMIVWTRNLGSQRGDAISTLERAIKGSDFFYVHCHGQFDPSRPLEASLLVDTTPPRSFTADEVLDLSPALADNRMVILAVCEGGEIVMQVTPDYQGFPLAFLEAGAPVVLAAPWKLSEPATPLLLSVFFEHMANGATIARALREAQVWLRDATRNEIIARLRSMSKQAIWPTQEQRRESKDAISMIRNAADALEKEGTMLASIFQEVESTGYDNALRALWNAKDPAGRWASSPDMLNLTTHIWSSLRDNPDVDALRDRIKDLLEHPFASPYYWGGLQAIGASLGTSITKGEKGTRN